MRLYNQFIHNKQELINKLFTVAKNKNYSIFLANKEYPINLNLWGIRSSDSDTKRYNDILILFYQTNDIANRDCEFKGKAFKMFIYEATTDPSDFYLLKPMNNKGTAIVVPNQYKGLWKIGLHKGKYKALVQATKINVFRDNNKDDIADVMSSHFTSSPLYRGNEINPKLHIDTGYFGINCHHAGNIISDFIGLYSAGCQVMKNTKLYNNEFLPIIIDNIKNTITYTLIEESNL